MEFEKMDYFEVNVNDASCGFLWRGRKGRK